MTKNNKRKKHGISKKRHIRTVLLIAAMLLTVTVAGCSREPSKPAESPTAAPTMTPKPTATATPEPTEVPTPSMKSTPKPTVKPTAEATPAPTKAVTPTETATPEPTVAPTLKPTTAASSGTVFIPSGTGGRVTFTGTTAEVSKAQVGDTVRFGSYEQDNDLSNGAEAIEWLVLDKQDGKLLLLSKDALDCKQYNETFEIVTWETCTLRSWLNGEFYNTAFSQTERGHILMTKVKNEDNPEYGTEGGNDTEDKIFLLSIEEVLRYFDFAPDAYDPARGAKVTEYAKAQGAWCSSYSGYAGNGWWWLRSPGGFDIRAAFVNDDGGVDMDGDGVNIEDGVVRPAFWLNLES